VEFRRGKNSAPETTGLAERRFFMRILVESNVPLFEVVQTAGKTEYAILLNQMEENPSLAKTLTSQLNKMPMYRFLTDDPILRYATLLEIIEGTMKRPQFETFFIKTTKGLYVGFIAIAVGSEDSKTIVEDVKTFSFGFGNEADENQIYKDLPSFLDKCLAKYEKVSWEAIEGNKANRAYEIYTKRHNGTIAKDGKYIRYTCIK
jgi:hypothetical protein